MAEVIRVKICGLVRREDALLADEAGADYLGVVMSAGFPRSVDHGRAGALVAETRARKVAVLVDESAETAAAAAEALGADVLQLHGQEPPSVVEALRGLGRWQLWKAVRARSLADVEATVRRYGALVDGVLLEGWKEGSLGVGGARLSLEPGEARELIPAGLDFVLAGGLRPDTVADAARRFRPRVVDVSSGVERAVGIKDPALVRAFLDAAAEAPVTGATK